ncbi:MAG: hypothetical protein HW421_3600 [Ignavibacteria bacterium]|nr:hypothetical protein [Ignavibacteria bacterium]
MNDDALATRISTLPNPLKNELLDYMEFLIHKHSPKEAKIHPKAGCMKGTFIMGDDFNAPLDCFKEYMP